MEVYYVPLKEIKKIRQQVKNPIELCKLLACIFRLNTLAMITEAGSGHLGTSFSSIDIITWLWTQEMKFPNQEQEKNSDIYFSSKGHDVPALYSLLIGLERLDYDLIHKLRQLNGLPGHPDVNTPNIATNTGPLGMGVAKARGMAKAYRLDKRQGNFYVLSGDGELQEGQIWESLTQTANNNFSEITLIVDHNKIQSDTWVKEVSDLGNIEEKFKSFGWEVKRCDGHDFNALRKAFEHFRTITDKPKVLIADTVKGKGVSFMEEVSSEDNLYKFHSGAPSKEIYQAAFNELIERANKQLAKLNLAELKLDKVNIPEKVTLKDPEKLVDAYSDELLKIAKDNKDIVALSADLVLDCGLIPFKDKYPNRFIECGIAEQDMVSMAGGLALKGKLPLAHSFACFLSTRPNEQIYNNATERKKIIYLGFLAGLLPGGPGHSHQSVRDISALGSIPGLTMIQPSNEQEVRLALHWAVEKNNLSSYLRIVSIPCELNYELPSDYELIEGRGVKIKEGKDAAIFAYGPVMLTEAIKASEELAKIGVELAVYNLPWLNIIDHEWFKKETKTYSIIFTLDDHYVKLGQGNLISSALAEGNVGKKVFSFGLREIPACGRNDEVLKYHQLDYKSIVNKVKENLRKP